MSILEQSKKIPKKQTFSKYTLMCKHGFPFLKYVCQTFICGFMYHKYWMCVIWEELETEVSRKETSAERKKRRLDRLLEESDSEEFEEYLKRKKEKKKKKKQEERQKSTLFSNWTPKLPLIIYFKIFNSPIFCQAKF